MIRFGAIAIVILLSVPAYARQSGPRDLDGQAAAGADQPQVQLQRSVVQLYLADMKNELGLTDEQFLKAGPVIQQFIQMRFRNANQRKALGERQDRLLSEPNAPPTDIKQLHDELTELDGQTASWDGRFMRRLQTELVGRELSDRQMLMLRDFNRRFFNEKLPTLVEQIRSENLVKGRGQQQRPAAARANQNRKDQVQPNGPANTLRGNNKPGVQPQRQKSTR